MMGKSLAELLAQSFERPTINKDVMIDMERIRQQYLNLSKFILADVPDNTERDECVRSLVNSMSAAVRACLLKGG